MRTERFVRCFAMFAALSASGGSVVFAQETKEPSEPRQTFTAPPRFGQKPKPKLPEKEDTGFTTPANAANEVSNALPRFEFIKVEAGNENNIPAGYYASFLPPAPDTVDVFEGGGDDHFTIRMDPGKEIIQGDSVTVTGEVEVRKRQLGAGVNEPLKRGKTNSMVTRSGFIPAQGFGTNRFRFAVRPGRFLIRRGALISASVHTLKPENNIGTILCAVTSVDYEKNTFMVEASNEIPLGESINWIIINYPDQF